MFKIHVQCFLNQCLNIFKINQSFSQSQSIQSNKAVIEFILEISFLMQYQEKEEQIVTNILIDKKENKTPPVTFDYPPFCLSHAF